MRFGDFIRKAVVSQLLRAVLSGALGAVSGIGRAEAVHCPGPGQAGRTRRVRERAASKLFPRYGWDRKVRIRLPPAESHVRTGTSAISP